MAARRRRTAPALAIVLLAAACGPDVYEAHGVIREVLSEQRQVVIEHEAIPGFMEAMTMPFDVPDAALLDRMQTGQVVDFRIEYDGRRVRVVDFRPSDATSDPRAGP